MIEQRKVRECRSGLNDLRMLGRHSQHVVSSARGFVVALRRRRRTHVNSKRREFITLLGGARGAACARSTPARSIASDFSRGASTTSADSGHRDRVSSFVRCDHEDVDRGTRRWRHPHRRLILGRGPQTFSIWRQPKHDDLERLRMIRECMGMHRKHTGRFTVSFRRQRAPLPRLHGQPWPPWIIVSAV